MESITSNQKTLAIDFGEKRVGLAISDVNGKIATPLSVLNRKDDADLIRKIIEISAKNSVKRILLGIPETEPGTQTSQEVRTRSFLRKLARATTIPVETWNEAFSTISVINTKKGLDAKAAASFLQEFLDSQKK